LHYYCFSYWLKQNYTKVVAVDLGFVMQGDDESELPERLIGAVRFHHLDVAGAVSFDTWESRPED
jgi:Protein ENHANCED DISEASE RESISTANCE 2, C-terminal